MAVRGGVPPSFPPLVPPPGSFFSILKASVESYTQCMSLGYEPASEPLHISHLKWTMSRHPQTLISPGGYTSEVHQACIHPLRDPKDSTVANTAVSSSPPLTPKGLTYDGWWCEPKRHLHDRWGELSWKAPPVYQKAPPIYNFKP